jgi:predicted nucleotide-binding protein
LTPDDIGCQEADLIKAFNLEGPFLSRNVYLLPAEVMQLQKRLKRRARQNVIFEMGYFWGMLERKRVCCLFKGNVEKPSDIEGIVYIPFKDSIEEIRLKIMKELKEAGYEVKI